MPQQAPRVERGREAQRAGPGRSGPDTAGRGLCKAFTEPGVPGAVALCLADGAPTAPCQEGASGSFPLLDGQKPQ